LLKSFLGPYMETDRAHENHGKGPFPSHANSLSPLIKSAIRDFS